jgi:Na+-transporting NADH:ubiquinone oxidoreductase subunit NqrC
MLIVVLLVALVLVVVVATIAAVLRDDRGAIAEDWAYDTRRPRP